MVHDALVGEVWCMMHLLVPLHLYFTHIQKVWVNEPKSVAKKTNEGG